MNAGFRLDTSEWSRAVTEYAAATGKTLAEAQNRQNKNWAIHAMRFMKKAEVQMINALEGLPWWPRYIAGIIGKQAGGRAASEAYQAQWSAGQKKMRDAAGRRGAWKLTDQEASYAGYARRLSRRILGRRKAAVTFMKAFLLSIARGLDTLVKDVRTPAIKAFTGFRVTVKGATARDLTCTVTAEYDYKKRGAKSARRAEALGMAALERAKPAAIADMKAYTERKLAENARRYSAA